MSIKIKLLSTEAKLPSRAYPSDSGLDISSAEEVVIKAGDIQKVSTGISFSVPKGWEVQIRPRSGLMIRDKVIAMFGTIDCSYRGEVGVLLHNTTGNDFKVDIGDRIAQLVIAKIELWQPELVEDLDSSNRGDKGLGSTGKN
ncbi:MAG: dUTP diphosphatase [Alphaproteobacteria bacterium]|nr:dUTP diphosphatase [Alphaproteobacteria bacterium]MBL0718003.1 dUTP diphosphatase [Alphaproteobacteria bacterium]